MKKYIGTKIIEAEPEIKQGMDGYKVVYPDGYVSWSPKDVFNDAYWLCENMTFGLAIESARKGKKVSRHGWNGKNMFIFYVPGSTFKVNRPPLLGIYPEGTEINYHAHLDMKTVDGTIIPWLASQSDILIDDWFIVDDE